MAHEPLEPGEGGEDLKRKSLVVLGPAKVGQHPALLLRPEGYPTGGTHGGHVAVVWNQQGNGYALSMHSAEDIALDGDDQEAVLLQAATAMSDFDGLSAR